MPLLALAAAAWSAPAIAADELCINYKLTPAAGTSLQIAEEELRRQLGEVGSVMSTLFGTTLVLDRCRTGTSDVRIGSMDGQVVLIPNRQIYVYNGTFNLDRPVQDPQWTRVTFSWMVSFTRNRSCTRTPDALAIASALIDFQRAKRRTIAALTRNKLQRWAVRACAGETPKPPSYDILLERLRRLEELEGTS